MSSPNKAMKAERCPLSGTTTTPPAAIRQNKSPASRSARDWPTDATASLFAHGLPRPFRSDCAKGLPAPLADTALNDHAFQDIAANRISA